MQDTGLVRYDAMCHAIAEAHQIDEVKDLRDKAMALERYAQQAMNTDAERKACEIRLRAELRVGVLLKDQAENRERATRGNEPGSNGRNVPRGNITKKPTLSDLGISAKQSSQWQKLANVPEQEFEDALRDPKKKPSTSGIIKKSNGSTEKMKPSALWLWGHLRDFERERITEENPEILFGEMTETMVADVRRLLPLIIAYLNTLEGYLDE